MRARLVWEHDGEEFCDTVARAYTTRLVLVDVLDRRRLVHGVWLRPSDVTRR